MDLQAIEKDALEELEKASALSDLEALKAKYLGRKDGALTRILRNLGSLSPEEKKTLGQAANQLKNLLQQKFDLKEQTLKKSQTESQLSSEKIDLTLPGVPSYQGASHPVLNAIREITQTMARIGFEVIEGPEIESEQNNFNDLNIPENHPARDMQDTFYLMAQGGKAPLLLRTHTSPVQIRFMKKAQPPFKVLAPGRVYRNEATDATHAAVFHQLEGLVVGPNVSFADLKGALTYFARSYFGANTKVRFRPSYFPFVEPGAEMDIWFNPGKGKAPRWMEILGAGMVHPQVLRNVGYDPEKVSGFAFGLGIERVVMQRYQINDIRMILESDQRFLEQFQ